MNENNIKKWAMEDQPAEKIMIKGPQGLTDAELISIIIGWSAKNELDLAKNVLGKNNLNILAKLSVHDLVDIGFNMYQAKKLVATFELGRRKDVIINMKKSIILSQNAYEHIYPYLTDLSHEEFWVIYLNRKNTIIDTKMHSKGGIDGTIVDKRLILKHAINIKSSAIILCHNHPTGDFSPSNIDKRLTEEIKNACKLLDIRLLDHIILGDKNYFSFADDGLI